MALSRAQIRVLRWLSTLERRWIPHERFGTLTVLYATSDADVRSNLSKNVKLALLLIKQRVPAWYRRIQNEITSVSFIELGQNVPPARFDLTTCECVINATPLLADPEWAVVEIALALVHEATHGWLFRHGVRTDTPERLQRVERVCNRAEMCLAGRVPEVPLLAKVVAVRRSRIADSYTTRATAKRKRAYLWALVRGALGG